MVQLIRHSQATYDLLAYMEHALIPDESFFATLIFSPDLKMSQMVISHLITYLKFQIGASHPNSLDDDDIDVIFSKLNNDADSLFFVRKMNASKDLELYEKIDALRNNFPLKNFL